MRIERDLMHGAVLKLLESGEKYGYELIEALAARSDGVLDMGQSTLYQIDQQTPLLRLAIGAGQHVHYQTALRIENH